MAHTAKQAHVNTMCVECITAQIHDVGVWRIVAYPICNSHERQPLFRMQKPTAPPEPDLIVVREGGDAVPVAIDWL